MDQEQAKAHMNKLLDEAGKRAADRNVEVLRRANQALGGGQQSPSDVERQRELQSAYSSEPLFTRRQSPGTRPDGVTALTHPVDIVRNAMEDARRIVDNFEKSTIELESKVAQLEAQLDAERAARTSLEKQIAQIVDLVSPS